MRETLKCLLGLGLVGALSCTPNDRAIELSDVLNEDAFVKERIYIPAHTVSQLVPKLNLDLDLSFEFEDVRIPDNYKVVFDGEYADFIVNGSEERYKKIWEQFLEGEKVRVSYRQKELLLYDMKKAEKELSKREIIGYEFVEASKITP